MSAYRLTVFGLITTIMLSLSLGTAWADRDKGREREWERKEYRQKSEYRPTLRYNDRDYILDKRHRHNQYYPRHGYRVKSLPHGYYRVPHRGLDYFFYEGIWYRSSGIEFYVSAPPIGVIIPVLPSFYTTIQIGGIPYYYADGTYYRWYPDRNGYMVVEAPAEADKIDVPVVPDELFVYPRMGQSEAQIAKDRYECHRWAVEQTGFDPTKPGGDVPAQQNAQKRSDYNRATKSCLEARDYSVQ